MSNNCYTARESIEIASRAGVVKARMRWEKTLVSSINAGFILSFACATVLSTNTAPWFQTNAPGLIRTIGALVFPYGLTIIILTGSDLCTGSFMYTTVACIMRRISVAQMLRHWFITFWGNLAGSLFIVTFITGYGGIFDSEAYKKEVQDFAIKKQVTPAFHMIFLRGIGANWLVCLACYLGMSGRDYVSKVAGIWLPAFAFVSLGFDHVVANMSFIPMGIWQGAPGITVGLYIWKGIIPALIGNIIGGGLFVGVLFWYLHIHGAPEISVDDVLFNSMAGKNPAVDARGLSLGRVDDIEAGQSDTTEKSVTTIVQERGK